MPNILITGAASGLGLAFLRAYADVYISDYYNATPRSEDLNVYVTDRDERVQDYYYLWPPDLDRAFQVERWASRHVKPFKMDVTDADAVQRLFGEGGRLSDVSWDVVIHSAGVRGLVDNGRAVEKYEDVRVTESLDVMDKRTMMKAFEINVAGTFELLRGCVPGLKAAKEKHPGHGSPKVIVMGSRMGSISNNTPSNASAGGAYAYRASKAALNAVVKSFAVDVPEAIWTVVHPGRVETGLVKVKEDGAMSVEESVGDMMHLIARLLREDSGRFVDRFGVDIPW